MSQGTCPLDSMGMSQGTCPRDSEILYNTLEKQLLSLYNYVGFIDALVHAFVQYLDEKGKFQCFPI